MCHILAGIVLHRIVVQGIQFLSVTGVGQQQLPVACFGHQSNYLQLPKLARTNLITCSCQS